MAPSNTRERVLVVGAGAMGTQIGAVFALGGHPVVITDISVEAIENSRAEAATRLERMVTKQQMSAEALVMTRDLLDWSDDLEFAARDADFVVEAASERLEIKRDLFARLGAVTPAHAILATNSSTIPSSHIAAHSGRADRVCNLHFFNPALVMNAVEVVPNPDTSEETVATVLRIVAGIGKQAVRLTEEIPGFIANRLMTAVQDEAIALYARGISSIEDIDAAARSALAHPMGPFELMDLVGNDVIYLMHEATHEMTGDPADLPHPALTALYESGRFGRKSGSDWYDYSS